MKGNVGEIPKGTICTLTDGSQSVTVGDLAVKVFYGGF